MQKIVLIPAVFSLLFSCTQAPETEAPVPAGEQVRVTLPLYRDAPSTPDTGTEPLRKSVSGEAFRTEFSPTETKHIPRAATTEFANTWLLQFDASGRNVLCRNIGTVDAGTDIHTTLITGNGQTLWVIGNGPATLTPPATLADFEGTEYFAPETYTDEASIPLAGKVADVTVNRYGEVVTADRTPVTVSLRRIAAKLSLTCTTTLSGYRITGVELFNAPQRMYYAYRNTTGLVNTGAVAAGVVAENTYTWFLGENLRGDGSSTAQDTRYAAKAPPSSTYIRITLRSDDGYETATYDIYPGKNLTDNYDIARNWDYIYTTTIARTGEDIASDPRTTIDGFPLPPSNCYILEPGKAYKIRINIKGEGQNVTGGQNVPLTNDVDNVFLMWQEQPGMVQELNMLSPEIAFIRFKPGVEGNAMLQARKGSATKWSWHLWVINGGSKSIKTYTYNGIECMDRNLGALTSTLGDANSIGVVYEWGRKDPFPGPVSVNTATKRTLYYIGGSIVQLAQYRGPQSIDFANQHPNWYIYQSEQWLSGTVGDIWGSEGPKTIFDPSPRGWRVPRNAQVWTDWTTANFIWDTSYPGRIYTSSDGTPAGTWFPAAGEYSYVNPTNLIQVGQSGLYWTAESTDTGKGTALVFSGAQVLFKSTIQTYGGYVRAVRDTP